MIQYLLFLILFLLSFIFRLTNLTPTPAPTTTVVPVAISAPVVIITPTQINIVLSSEEQEFLRLLSDYRHDELIIDANLTEVARWMSNDMYINDRFSHADSLGRDTFARLAHFGVKDSVYTGENLAKYSITAQIVFDAWRDSPAHNITMLDEHMSRVGVSYIEGYWTLLLTS